MENLISKEEAIEAVNKALAPYIPFLTGFMVRIPLECATAINDLPTIEQKGE